MEVTDVNSFDMHAVLRCPLLGLANIDNNNTLVPVSANDEGASNRGASQQGLRSSAPPSFSLTDSGLSGYCTVWWTTAGS